MIKITVLRFFSSSCTFERTQYKEEVLLTSSFVCSTGTIHNVYAWFHSPFYARFYDRMTRRAALKGKHLDRVKGQRVEGTGWRGTGWKERSEENGVEETG